MRHLYTISELTDLFQITTRTLRYYEEIGLLHPRRRGTQRLYAEADRARIDLILRSRRLGFGLEEIRELLELYDTDPTNVIHLEDVLNRGNRKIREVEKQLHDLQSLHAELVDVRERILQALDERVLDEGDSGAEVDLYGRV
ncbi:MerR family transcriptional regulator [Alicyclobacillus ferrooxydans]|uniref:MerR family transcriptional regulator n=1 Tax=Alicyclobacillus ferrooxydans TaxID=471514 RepID=UPI0009FB1A4E|nr:MerR family transcriptional regulator [Alicyclobacillus ferrooxydans]